MQRQPLIVAIMQPNWFKVANAVKFRTALNLYADVDQWRQVLLRSEQGKKCQRYMKELFDITIWRCANPGRPLSNVPGHDYDVAHVETVLKEYSPDIVIAFGFDAQNGINKIFKQGYKTIKPMPFELIISDDIEVKPVVDFGMINLCKAVRDLIEKL